MDIALVGGGIGGLTAAACLLRDGHRVRIYEQARHVGEIGAAVQMSANAVKVLYHLGLKDRLEAQAVKPTAFEFRRFDSGEVLHEIKLGEDHAQRHGHPYYQIHRVDLHAALLEVVERLDPQALQLGYRAIEVLEDEHSDSIVFDDGRQVRANLVVGSDGIKSVVRKHVVDADPPVFTGQVAWR
jgi:salicylate hydroxylase